MAKSVRKTSYEVNTISNEEMFEMRKSDWERCKRMVKRIPKQSKLFSSIYSISFGVGVTSGLTIIPLYSIENLNSFIMPFYIIFTIFAFLFGIIIFIIDKKNFRSVKDKVEEIKEEMDEIDKLY